MSNATSVGFDDWSRTTCKRETQLFGAPASPSQPSGRELVDAFGRNRELVFCGGSAVLAALGWAEKPGRLRLTYEPGEREIITQCPGREPQMTIDSGAVRLEIAGSAAMVSIAELNANLKSPQLVRLYGSEFGSRCDLQLTAWSKDDKAEACLSLRGPNGEFLYASFRSQCD